MKLTRLLLCCVCANILAGLAGYAATTNNFGAGELVAIRLENAPLKAAARTVTNPTEIGPRMVNLIKTGGRINLSERLALTPRLEKGGVALRVNLNF